jgi:hypothetical protein
VKENFLALLGNFQLIKNFAAGESSFTRSVIIIHAQRDHHSRAA